MTTVKDYFSHKWLDKEFPGEQLSFETVHARFLEAEDTRDIGDTHDVRCLLDERIQYVAYWRHMDEIDRQWRTENAWKIDMGLDVGEPPSRTLESRTPYCLPIVESGRL